MAVVLLAVATIILDQITKIEVRRILPEGAYHKVIGDFFRLTHFENDGAAFSTFSGQNLFLITLPIVVVIVAAVYMARHKNCHMLLKVAVGFIVGGGIGNLIDRAIWGSVTDMFSFSIFPAIFNVADIAVVIGCFLLVLYVIKYEKLENIDDGK